MSVWDLLVTTTRGICDIWTVKQQEPGRTPTTGTDLDDVDLDEDDIDDDDNELTDVW